MTTTHSTNTLHNLCINIPKSSPPSSDDKTTKDHYWDDIRDWFDNQSPIDARTAIERDHPDFGTPLHVLCRKNPPIDIVASCIALVPDAVCRQETRYNFLPLHVACAHDASYEVLTLLVEAYPESIHVVDTRSRVPLHFAITTRRYDLTKEMMTLLLYSTTRATAGSDDEEEEEGRERRHGTSNDDKTTATCLDESGKAPLHYACAHGISKEALRVLTASCEDCIEWGDVNGFTPFHYALSNCVPYAVEHLLSLRPHIVNQPVGGSSSSSSSSTSHNHRDHYNNRYQIPLELLAVCAAKTPPTTTTTTATQPPLSERATSCLLSYVDAKPRPTATFIAALQSLPPYLHDVAVVHPFVQSVINKRMSERCHFAFYFFDFLFLVGGMIAFAIGVVTLMEEFGYDYTKKDDDGNLILDEEGKPQLIEPPKFEPNDIDVGSGVPIVLLLTGSYFLFRETIQIFSLLSMGLFRHLWLKDPTNWLDVACIVSNYGWAFFFIKGEVENDELVRVTACCTLFMLSVWLMMYLKSASIGFAVFFNGLYFVVKRLMEFVMALASILIAFALIFYFAFQKTSQCSDSATINGTDTDIADEEFPFCKFSLSLLTTTTMLIGEVSDTYFYEDRLTICLFAIYMFLVVILLANVLIAIVTDAYGVIKNERASIVFWSNRLDFIAEIDVIVNGLLSGAARRVARITRRMDDHLRDTWDELMADLMDDYFFVRLKPFLLLTFLWMPLGLVTAGMLWPPQMREFILHKRATSGSNDKDGDNDARHYQHHHRAEIEMTALQDNVKDLQNEIDELMSHQCDKSVALKNKIQSTKRSIATEVDDIKDVMREFFDLHVGEMED